MDFQLFPPTRTQTRMLKMADSIDNLCVVFRLEGALDEVRLEKAIQTVIENCLPLSFKFLRVGEGQRIFVSRDLDGISRIDGSGDDEAFAFSMLRNLRRRKFRLDGGAPYNFCLIKAKSADFLAFACHPTLIDRFSIKPLFAAIAKAYRGEALSPDLGLSQDDLAAAESNLLMRPRYQESMRFWMKMVRDSSFDWHPPRLENDLTDNSFSVALGSEQSHRLIELAQRLNLETELLLLFSFHLFLSRVARSETVITTFSHRIRTGRADQIGFNENTAAFKSVVQPGTSVKQFFNQASRLFAQTRYHCDLPAREILQELQRSDPAFKRVTNIMVTDDHLPYEFSLPGVKVTLLPMFSHRLEGEDVAIYFDVQKQITFHALARSPQEISGLRLTLDHYLAMLGHIPDSLDLPVDAVPLLTADLRRKVLQLSSGGDLRVAPRDPMVHFEDVVGRMPDAPAIRFRDRSISYRELHASAASIAAGLAQFVASGEARVGICLPRGEGVIQAIFGTLAAGAGYVPMDPTMPHDRLSYMIQDAMLAVVIVDATTETLLEGTGAVVCRLENLLQIQPTPKLPPPPPSDRVAYVIYTSGTTGQPKGVVLERRQLAHLLAALDGIWEGGPGVRWLQFAAVTFDASVLEIFNALAFGAELVIAPPESRTDPEALFELLKTARVSHAVLPPAMLPLLPRRPLPDFKVIVSGGEAVDEETARFWSKTVELANCYGPTEATVMATLNRLGGYKAATHLGRPIPGYQTYLIDEHGELAPRGGIGEIAIGGEAVARGYFRRPELTDQKFIPNPFGEGRLYRTGDLGRLLPSGDLEFLGRCDFQVKIRGFRIELGDIQYILDQQPEINQSYVGVADQDGAKALVAWYSARSLTVDVLRERMGRQLPHYMVPSYFVRVESFPLTLNGKIDRARLPAPKSEAQINKDQLSDFQTEVRTVWAQALKIQPPFIHLNSHFFHLGGHSLLVAMVCNRLSTILGTSIRPKILFEHPVLLDFCESIGQQPAANPEMKPLASTGALAAPVENRLIGLLYSRAISVPMDNMYNIVSRIEFAAEMNANLLARAFADLLRSHPIFHAQFNERNGQIWVEAQSLSNFEISVGKSTVADVRRRTEALRQEAIGVQNAPLWRAEIHQTDDQTILLFSIHHALFDGWSLNLLSEELAARVQAIHENRVVHFPRLTWFDYCLWARDLPKTEAFVTALSYWRKKLDGATARIDLPTELTQKSPDSNRFITVQIGPKSASQLKEMADGLNITLSPLLFSIYLVWLWRLSNQEELVCGYPYAGRDISGSEEIYGTFVTMGFLRQRIQSEQAFVELAKHVHHQMIEDKDHLTAAPYDAEIAEMDRLNTIFSLQTGISLDGSIHGIPFRTHELPSRTSKGDLAGIFYQTSAGAIEGRIEFDSSLFRLESVEKFVDVFRTLVMSVIDQPTALVGELKYQSEAENRRLLSLATGPQLDVRPASIPTRFREMVQAHPERVAVRFEQSQLTYAELDEWSDRIARQLQTDATGSYVGLSVQKSHRAIAALLGILKAGCAYVPLDPRYPKERLSFFVQNCGLSCALTDDASRAQLEEAGIKDLRILMVENLLAAEPRPAPPLQTVGPNALAYVIHTSGSTGVPKGVMIEHQSVVAMAAAARQALEFGSDDSMAQIASFNFDASVLEIFLPLLNGGTLVVVSEPIRQDPQELHRFVDQQRLTHVILSPVVLKNFPRLPLKSLKLLCFGGDTVDAATAEWWSQQARLMSLYGPTETTVECSCGEIKPGGLVHSIGRPLPGSRLYLLNPDRQLVPAGAIGEIGISGGAARGYLNRDDLTNERFLADPFDESPYGVMYMSGDLGRYRDDGTIEYLGRNDAQVKVRGFRIELGEIENHLMRYPGLAQVACAAKGEVDNKYLVAYYEAPEELNAEDLRRHLQVSMPDYMVPAFFVHLPKMPISPSGKIDRLKLPDVKRKSHQDDPPHEGLESRIGAIWEEVLRCRGIGRNENFFHIGGNSLLAVRMQAELNRRLGFRFSVADFYGDPTIQALASRASTNPIHQAVDDVRTESDRFKPTALACAPASQSIETVLLTGAAGFLGMALLPALCERAKRVYALVRCENADAGLDLLLRRAKSAGVDLDPKKIEIIPGDLTKPNLALSETSWEKLASDVDAIVHCGAYVHHLHSYSALRAANVLGTTELLQLALTTKKKQFCFVSTLTAGMATTNLSSVREEILPDMPAVDNGYVLSKWVGERIVATVAKECELPALIVRPGNITGDSRSGYSNFAHNHFWLFTKGCLQLGAYPELDASVEMMPVDWLAHAIAALASSPRQDMLVANLCNPRSISQRHFFDKLDQLGWKAAPQPANDWQRLIGQADESNALSTIRDLYLGDLSGKAPPVAQRLTLAALQTLGIKLPSNYDEWLPLYMEYLAKEGFLSKARP